MMTGARQSLSISQIRATFIRLFHLVFCRVTPECEDYREREINKKVVSPSGSCDAFVSGTALLSLNTLLVLCFVKEHAGENKLKRSAPEGTAQEYIVLYTSANTPPFLWAELFPFVPLSFQRFPFVLLAPPSLRRGKQITERQGCGARASGKLLSNLANDFERRGECVSPRLCR